jgi:hypothetical protein
MMRSSVTTHVLQRRDKSNQRDKTRTRSCMRKQKSCIARSRAQVCSEAHTVLQRRRSPGTLTCHRAKRGIDVALSPHRHVLFQLLGLCSRLCVLLVFPFVDGGSVGFSRLWPWLSTPHTPSLCPPPSNGHRCITSRRGVASFWWRRRMFILPPPSALGKCWLRALHPPLHTHMHRTRLLPCPASTRRPDGASRLRHVVWMVAPSAALLAEGICTICSCWWLWLSFFCCVPLHRDAWGHTHAAATTPAPWRLRLWRGIVPGIALLNGQQPGARPFCLDGPHEPFVVLLVVTCPTSFFIHIQRNAPSTPHNHSSTTTSTSSATPSHSSRAWHGAFGWLGNAALLRGELAGFGGGCWQHKGHSEHTTTTTAATTRPCLF